MTFLRRLTIAAGLLVLLAVPARAQFLPGEFATPEQELAALFRMLHPDDTDAEVMADVALWGPSVIIPAEPPSKEREWAHFQGGRVDSAAADFVWGTVAWQFVAEPEPLVTAEIEIPERSLSGTLTISPSDLPLPFVAMFQLDLAGDWADPVISYPGTAIRASSRVVVNPIEIDGLGYRGGVSVTGDDVNAILSKDTVGMSVHYRDGRTLVLTLALGETGRAVFDQALAAWGLTPAGAE